MRTYTLFLAFILSSTLNAETVTGIGFAPIIKNNIALSRILATFDSVGDAMMKTSMETSSESEMRDTLMSSQTVSIKVPDREIRIEERKCTKNKNVLKCDVKFSLGHLIKRKESFKKTLDECDTDPGINHCFIISKIENSYVGGMIIARVSLEEVVLWKSSSKTLKLKSKTKVISGIGNDTERARSSAIKQIKSEELMSMFFERIRLFEEIRVPTSDFNRNHRAYLSTLGGYSACSQGICSILVPKILF